MASKPGQFPIRRVGTAILLMVALLLGGAAGYHLLGDGRWPFSDCLYMTVITVATVGFQEVVPIAGDQTLQAYTIGLILTGSGLMVFLLSEVTAFVVEGSLNEIIRRRRMDREISKLRDHFIVCGIGRNGEYAAVRLVASGFSVVLVDESEKHLKDFIETHGREIPYVVGDATDELTLTHAGIERARGLIASLPEDQQNIFMVLSARQMCPKLRIVAKLNEKRSFRKFQQVGADAVVSPAVIGGMRMFSEMVQPGVTSFLDDILNASDVNLTIDEVLIPEGSALHGRTLAESDIRRRTNLLVVGVRDSDTGRFTYNPAADTLLSTGMTLIVLGPKEAMGQIRKMTGAWRVEELQG